MAQPKCFAVNTVPFAQLTPNDQERVVNGLQNLVDHLSDFRVFTYVLPNQMDGEWFETRSNLAKNAPQPWMRKGFQSEIWTGRQLSKEMKLKDINSYLYIPEYETNFGDLIGWGVSTEEVAPPPAVQGKYVTSLGHLSPVKQTRDGDVYDNERPYATIVSSYEFKDTWDWYNPLGRLILESDGPMVLAIDAKRVKQHVLERNAASWSAKLAQSVQSNTQNRLTLFQTQKTAEESGAILEAVLNGQALHEVRILIMLLDTSLENMQARKDRLIGQLKGKLEVDELRGYQNSALEYFTPKRTIRGLPQTPHNVLSPGTARAIATIAYNTDQQYTGTFLGIGRGLFQNQITGLEYINHWEGKKAGHKLILGETGFGKTVLAHCDLVRQAESGVQCIMIEPQGHSGRHLHPYFGDDLSSYNPISMDRVKVNPLDVVFVNYADQFSYFQALLEMLLNSMGNVGDGRPTRYLKDKEVLAVQAALRSTYTGVPWDQLYNNTIETPQMDQFCAYLKNVKGGEELADYLEQLYVTGVFGNVFNAQSNLNTHLKRPDGSLWPVVIYDLQHISENWRALFYFIMLAGISRESRRAIQNIRERPRRAVYIDEFRYMSAGSPYMNEWLSDQIATARTFSTSYTVIDQNPVTFMGEGAGQIARIKMLENMAYMLTFRLRAPGVERLRTLYPHLTESHAQYLLTSGIGHSLMIDRNMSTRLVNIMLRPKEKTFFLGS